MKVNLEKYLGKKLFTTRLKKILAKKPLMQNYYLLNAIEAIICPSSTLLVEAERAKIPALCVAFRDNKYDVINWYMNTKYQPHFKIFRKSANCIFCWKIDNFEKCLKKLLYKKIKFKENIYKKIVFENNLLYVDNIKKNIKRVIF